jgi:hypothetical protein
MFLVIVIMRRGLAVGTVVWWVHGVSLARLYLQGWEGVGSYGPEWLAREEDVGVELSLVALGAGGTSAEETSVGVIQPFCADTVGSGWLFLLVVVFGGWWSVKDHLLICCSAF